MNVHTEEKNKKLILIILLFFLVFIFLFQEAYAKYRKYASVQVDNNIAKWDIKINNELIGNKTTLTNRITPVIIENDYVKQNVLAPGSLGYFDVNIDATDADVSFTYEIDISKYDSYTINDLVIYAYSVNDLETKTDVADDKINGTIVHNTASTVIRIYFKWLDDGTDTMNNKNDTTVAVGGTSNADVLVNFHLTQIKS